MPTLSIPVDEEKFQDLQQAAVKLGVSIEELVRLGVDDFLARRQQFDKAADYVLQKNAELYRRLAQ